jgi:hypothetical protein
MKKPLLELNISECKYALEFDREVVGHWWFCADPTRDRDASYCTKHSPKLREATRGVNYATMSKRYA